MKLTYVTIILTRDTMTKAPKVVAPWEVPAFRSLYGDESVQVLDNSNIEYEVDELPDAKEEFARMRALFGTDEDTKQSHVDIVYGRAADGIKALEAAIKAAASSGDVEAAQAKVDAALGYKPDKDVVEARKAAHDTESSFDPLETTAEVDPDRDAAAVAAKAVADAAAQAATKQGAKVK